MELNNTIRSTNGFIKEYTGINRPWNFQVTLLTSSQIFTYIEGTTAFLFVNTGTSTVQVNGKVLFPGTFGSVLGDAFAIAAHKDDIFKGIIKIAFFPPLGANPQLEATQIFYMDVKQK